MARGRFITLEGGEGVGKSTQAAALATAIRAHGMDAVETREPGGSQGAERIRSLLLHAEADAWNPRVEALLFAAARSDHVTRTIEPALSRGAWVICDRFLDSSRAYQGGTDGVADADLIRLHAIGSRGIMPDRTLLLRLEEEASLERRRRRGEGNDRFEERGARFHARVAERFDAIAAAEPERVRVVPAAGTPAEVTTRLLAALSDLL